RDLEAVVDALKRVTEKLRAENERLRRGAAEGAGRAEAERAARSAKKRAGELKEEVDRLASKAREAEDAVHRLAQKQDLVNQLRRKLKARDDDLKVFQEKAEGLADAKALLATELEAANQRLLTADRDRASIPPPQQQQQQQQHQYQQQLATAEAEAEALRDQRMIRRSSAAGSGHDHAGLVGGEGAGGADARGGFVRLERENRRLKEENEKLSNELQAFDLDFFEEIEDLKYKYSEAARKLRQYE
ncbi:unnamed protein product, partial [Sphacelaria rigidula]